MAKCRSRACKLRRAQEQATQSAVQAQLVPNTTPNALSNIGNGGLGSQQSQGNFMPQLSNQPWQAPSGGGLPGPMVGQGKKEGFLDSLRSKPESTTQFPIYNQDQSSAFQWALGQALQGLSQNGGFGPIADQARENFREQTIPSIAERFTSLGAQGSSAFPQQLSQAGRGLETDLSALQAGYNQDQQRMLLSLLGLGLSPQFETTYTPAQPGFGRSLATSLAGGIGSALPGALTGGLSTALGGLSNLAGAFKRVPGSFGT